MNKYNLIIALIITIVSTSCTKLGVVVANFPSLFSSQKITRNIEFGSNYNSKLDVYTPAESKAKSPVIVFYHGGKWSFGSKNDYRFVADAFTSLGYIVVIPDYVKYPKVKFPVWQEDAAKAVVWVHNNIAKYSGDPEQIFILGHSAGGHIGALLVADNEYLAKQGGDRKWIKAFAGLAAPYNFIPDDPELVDMFGPEERYKLMHVTNYIDGKQAPMLLLWGKDDVAVGEVNIKKIAVELKKTKSNYEVKYYDGVDHIDIIAALSIAARNRAPVISDIDSFFKKNSN